MKYFFLRGYYDGWIALTLLILSGLSFLLPRNLYPEWRYWIYSFAPSVLLTLTIGFSLSAFRQPQKFNKYLGIGIIIFICLGFLATPQIME